MEELNRTVHEGDFAYEVAVPARGRYVTQLHLAELADGTRASQKGQRVFSENVEGGRPEVRDLDLEASHGCAGRSSSTSPTRSATGS